MNVLPVNSIRGWANMQILRNVRTVLVQAIVFAASAFIVIPAGSVVAQDSSNPKANSRKVTELAEKLGSKDLEKKRNAAYSLARLGADALPALKALIKTIESERDSQVWVQSATAIARIGPDAKDAINALVDSLGERDEQRRYRAAFALGRIGVAAVPELKKALKSRSTDKRAAAALSLGWIGAAGSDAVPNLVDLLSDTDVQVRDNASSTLEKIGQPARKALLEAVVAKTDRSSAAIRILSRIGVLDDSARGVIESAMGSDDVDMRAAAMSAALRTPSQDFLEIEALLRRVLTDPVEQVRTVGLLELRRRNSTTAAKSGPLLEELLDSERTEVVQTAARGLGILGEAAESSVPKLIELMQAQTDDDPTIMRAVARIGPVAVPYLLQVEESSAASSSEPSNGLIEKSLAEIGPLATQALVAAMGHDHENVRLRAIRSLGRMDGLQADTFASIVMRLADPDARIRAAAAESLGLASELLKRDNEAFLTLAKSAQDSEPAVRRAAVVSMSAASSKGVRQIILGKAVKAALVDSDSSVRTGGLLAMTRSPEIAARFVDQIVKCLEDDHVDVRVSAAGALAKLDEEKLKENKSADSLATSLVSAMADPSDAVKSQAAEAVGATKAVNDKTVAALCNLMSSSNPTVIRPAISALANLRSKSPPVVAGLLKLNGHPNAAVRAAVADALPKLVEDKQLVVQPLLLLVKDSDWDVRREAAHSLGDLGHAAVSAVPTLFELLKVDDDQDFARNALKEIDTADGTAVPVLIDGLKSGDRRRVYYAVFLLTKVGPDAKDALPQLAATRKETDSGRLRGMIDKAVEAIGKGK